MAENIEDKLNLEKEILELKREYKHQQNKYKLQ